jgi:hypothetical protein
MARAAPRRLAALHDCMPARRDFRNYRDFRNDF